MMQGWQVAHHLQQLQLPAVDLPLGLQLKVLPVLAGALTIALHKPASAQPSDIARVVVGRCT